MLVMPYGPSRLGLILVPALGGGERTDIVRIIELAQLVISTADEGARTSSESRGRV